jgi:hypothetical protein
MAEPGYETHGFPHRALASVRPAAVRGDALSATRTCAFGASSW